MVYFNPTRTWAQYSRQAAGAPKRVTPPIELSAMAQAGRVVLVPGELQGEKHEYQKISRDLFPGPVRPGRPRSGGLRLGFNRSDGHRTAAHPAFGSANLLAPAAGV